jgi:hypothetical protein
VLSSTSTTSRTGSRAGSVCSLNREGDCADGDEDRVHHQGRGRDQSGDQEIDGVSCTGQLRFLLANKQLKVCYQYHAAKEPIER